MAKIMLFIDGTWLYANTARLSEVFGRAEYRLDFGKLPRVLAEEVGSQLGVTGVDVVRTYLFASIASNHDPLDRDLVGRRQDFFDMLKEEYHYEVEVYPVNYMGKRLRRVDRDPADAFEPKEKCVDISLATSMLYFAAIPYAYDIAIAVLGDQDFKPVLQHVRRLGKRVAIASVKGSCTWDYVDPRDEARVKDFDIIWLDNLLSELELKYEAHYLRCESSSHQGPREVLTEFHPRKGKKFYCDDCREEYSRPQEAQRQAQPTAAGSGEAAPEAGSGEAAPEAGSGEAAPEVGAILRGVVKTLKKGYGFLKSDDGLNYYFHFSALQGSISFDDLDVGEKLDFVVKKQAGTGVNGSAERVRRAQ
ncbi:MAG: hypothetical protein DDT38_00909 [Firmicutes bacterium]|nr:hypothetical protein [candidate division NPL-UPA2 bacterium]